MAEAVPDISVVISTYNRCLILPEALESVLRQETDGVTYEVIVVDNNSTDDTRSVIESFVRTTDGKIRYLFEGKQGLSHGWNAGIEASSAPIIAFTDDDIIVSKDWIANVKKAFELHEDISFIGGKMLPVWPSERPKWLVREMWAPLALQDSETQFFTDENNPICLLNKCFRREAFDAVGGFKPELGRIKDGIGSIEDDELQRRLWKSGRRGLHVPDLVVHCPVDAKRMTKSYFRAWHKGHGRHYAIMRESGFERSRGRLFDVPLHLYRQAMAAAWSWAANMLSGNPNRAFSYEVRLQFCRGFFYQRRKDFRTAQEGVGGGTVKEFMRFAKSLLSDERESTGSGGTG